MTGPSSRPRLVATDLDGTLVRSDGTISARTAAILAAVEATGVPVVFVTGRPLRWAAEVFEHVGEHGLAVVSNGALVWDVAADTARLTRPIPPETVLQVCADLRARVPRSAFAVEDLDAAVERAVSLGARLADPQPGETWRVLIDAAGHPFCLTDAASWG